MLYASTRKFPFASNGCGAGQAALRPTPSNALPNGMLPAQGGGGGAAM
jgi:hypothetical protein